MTSVAPGVESRNHSSIAILQIVQAELKVRGVSLLSLLIGIPCFLVSYYGIFTVPLDGQTLSDLDTWIRVRVSAILQITINLPSYLFAAAIVGIMGGLGLKVMLIALGFWSIRATLNITAALVPLPLWIPSLLDNTNWAITMFFLFLTWHRARQSQIAPDEVAQLRQASVWWILAVLTFDGIVAISIDMLGLIFYPSFPYWSSVLFAASAYIGREVAFKFLENPYAEFIVTMSTGMSAVFTRLSVTQFVGIGTLISWEFYLSGICLVIRISLAIRQSCMRKRLTLQEKQIIARVVLLEGIAEAHCTAFYYVGCGITTGMGSTMATMICFSFVLQFVTSVAVSFILMKYQQVNVVQAVDSLSVKHNVLCVVSCLFGCGYFSLTAHQLWTGTALGDPYAVRNVTLF